MSTAGETSVSTSALCIAVSTAPTMRRRDGNRGAEGFNGDSVGLAVISAVTRLVLERKEAERHIDPHQLAVTPAEKAERSRFQWFAGRVQGLRP